MSRAYLATIERRANLKAEAQAKAREDEVNRQAARAETIALASVRGTEFDAPAAKRGERQKPMRRLSGLEWLRRKDRITEEQKAAGERYGVAYRITNGEVSLRSILNRDVTGGDGPTVQSLVDSAQARLIAKGRLEMFRERLGYEPSLVMACDIVCGCELTPREASADGHEAGKVEALLVAALNLMTEAKRA